MRGRKNFEIQSKSKQLWNLFFFKRKKFVSVSLKAKKLAD